MYAQRSESSAMPISAWVQVKQLIRDLAGRTWRAEPKTGEIACRSLH